MCMKRLKKNNKWNKHKLEVILMSLNSMCANICKTAEMAV